MVVKIIKNLGDRFWTQFIGKICEAEKLYSGDYVIKEHELFDCLSRSNVTFTFLSEEIEKIEELR